MEEDVNTFLKNLKFKIKKLHIRFEDDYFSAQSPFSLGLVVDEISFENSDSEWSFNSLL